MAPKQPPSNLPTALSSFIGRERELAEVQQQLRVTRLLTLTGPGGCGKTRLALRVAHEMRAEFDEAVWLVEFAPLADGGLVPQAVASVLGLHEQAGRSLAETIAGQLGQRRALLIFDNCEHLVAACAQLASALLQACPGLRLLATSRETLNLAGEKVRPVPPLSLPEPQPWRGPASSQAALPAYAQSEAVSLFVDRAAAASPSFSLTSDNGPWVATICRRLDGMPLAIELAAARVRALSVQQIAQRLEDRFHLLVSGSRSAPARHQSLEATLDWSYALLPAGEQAVLQRLSVFAGGCLLEAAEAVCAGGNVRPGDVLGLLSRLVDKSLVQADQAGGDSRYRLLETIRQYAAGQLADAGSEPECRDRHLDYFIGWAEHAELQLAGPDKIAWLGWFEAEHDNLRAALAWSLESDSRAERGLRLASRVGNFWRHHGYHSEGRLRLAAALAQPGAEQPTNAAARLRALSWAGWLAFFQSDYPATRAICQASLALCPTLGEAGQARRADALEMLAEVETEQGHYAAALPLYEEALAIYRLRPRGIGFSNALTMLGWLAMRVGDYERAAINFEEALRHCRALGDLGMLAQALAGRGELAVRQDDYRLAAQLLEESLAMRREIGEDWGIAISLGSLAWLALRQRQFQRARQLLAESLAIRRDSGDMGGSAWCLERLAEAALLQAAAAPSRRLADHQRAARVFGAAARLRGQLGAVMDVADQPEYEHHLAGLRASLGTEVFAAEWAAGEALPLEQAAAYALAAAEIQAAPEGAAADETAAPLAENFGGLTARERQVAALIAQGQSNRKIAEALVVSVKTIETYVTRILNKLGFDSRVQIATWAVEKGLLPPS